MAEEQLAKIGEEMIRKLDAEAVVGRMEELKKEGIRGVMLTYTIGCKGKREGMIRVYDETKEKALEVGLDVDEYEKRVDILCDLIKNRVYFSKGR